MRTMLPPLLAMLLVAPLTAPAQWQPEVRLTNNTAESITCFNNARGIATSGTAVHAVWHDSRDGAPEIYYKRSTDGGLTWGSDRRLTQDGSWSERPSVATCGSVVHVAWYDGRLGPPRIFHKRSPDNGVTWEPDVCLTPDAGVGYHPCVAACRSMVHVVWTDMSAGPQIYHARPTDFGVTWGAARNITPDAPAAGKNLAAVAVADSIVHVTWTDSRSVPRIYYTRSSDHGVTWEPGRGITPMPSQFASVAVSSATVHVAYADFREGEGSPRIYFTRSMDSGTNWSTETPLAEAFASWYPSVAAAGATVHTIWLDNRHGDVSEIYARSSLDDGMSWGPETRLTTHPAESREPSLAVFGNEAHVVWNDDRDGNWEIYYMRGAMAVLGLEGGRPGGAISSLLQVGPNPSAGPVLLRYELPSSSEVFLEVFGPSGARVCRLSQGPQAAGLHEIRWDGRDAMGQAVPSGVYLTRIVCDGVCMSGRVVVAR